MEVRVIANRGLGFSFFRFSPRRNGAGLDGSLRGTDAPRSFELEILERKVSGSGDFRTCVRGRSVAVRFPVTDFLLGDHVVGPFNKRNEYCWIAKLRSLSFFILISSVTP